MSRSDHVDGRSLRLAAILLGLLLDGSGPARVRGAGDQPSTKHGDSAVTKSIIRGDRTSSSVNLLRRDGWRPQEQGFERQGELLACGNKSDPGARKGAFQRVVLNQDRPQPIVAFAESKAEAVSGSGDDGYSLYLDVVFNDGTELWGQHARFSNGTHDWQRRRVLVLPDRPIRSVNVSLLFRGHTGRVWFREPALYHVTPTGREVVFDGLAVEPSGILKEGFQVRDVAADTGFVRIQKEALGLRLEAKENQQAGAKFFDVVLHDESGKDRAVTLVYTIPVAPAGLTWLEDPRTSRTVEAGREYVLATAFQAVGSGRLSSYPLAALARPGNQPGLALGIDMARPAFYRIGYNAATSEFWIAFDLGLAPEKPLARLRFCRFDFPADWAFRSALARYYELFPEAFRRRIAVQGLWMPFAKISLIKGWEDFHFRFKEGNDETAWDDQHGILTFRYTEPLTWWMPMPAAMSRTIEAAGAEARRLADRGKLEAKALVSSGYHDREGSLTALFRDEPWNHGAVWSMNSMPGIAGDHTDFKIKWSPAIRERLYTHPKRGELDGEYIDSSEGYVTAELDFRRDHFAASDSPLVFSSDDPRPAIFRGLIAFEYTRAIAADVHGMGKLMMANSTPDRFCWLAPMLDVMGTETDWNPRGRWRPMSDADLLYRRALCRTKPYCFLMNTAFEHFSHEQVEKYMKRSLAYGFFPGFFSHNASEGHYFTRPELYDRDRPLFKKYLPVCKLLAEAGWEPITLARSSDPNVRVERFGDRAVRYLTLFNDGTERRVSLVTLEEDAPTTSRELISGRTVSWVGGQSVVPIDGEDVQVLELKR
jgi:hypothetical protein